MKKLLVLSILLTMIVGPRLAQAANLVQDCARTYGPQTSIELDAAKFDFIGSCDKQKHSPLTIVIN